MLSIYRDTIEHITCTFSRLIRANDLGKFHYAQMYGVEVAISLAQIKWKNMHIVCSTNR